MPLLHHPMLRPFRSNSQSIELARETDREIANIDHLLHLALPFCGDFPGFQCDERAQLALGIAESVAKLADDVAALRSRHLLPLTKRSLGALYRALVFVGCRHPDRGEHLAVNRRNAL